MYLDSKINKYNFRYSSKTNSAKIEKGYRFEMRNRVNVLLDCILENYSQLITKKVFENMTNDELEETVQTMREKYEDSSFRNKTDLKKEYQQIATMIKDDISNDRDTLSVDSGDHDEMNETTIKTDKNEDAEVESNASVDDISEDDVEEKPISNH